VVQKHANEISSNSSNEKMSLLTKLSLGVGESVQGIHTIVGGYYLNAFILETACVDAMYVGLIHIIQGVFDSLNDPLIGFASDRTRTRWGRRRPWLLFAAPVLAVFYFGLWNALPRGTPQIAKFLYALVCAMGVSGGISSIQVQIGALVPELTDDYDERTTVSAFRLGVGNAIGLLFAMAHTQIVDLEPGKNPEESYRFSGALLGIVLWGSAWIAFAGIREQWKPRQETRKKMGIGKEIKVLFKNRAFMCVVGMYLCGPLAIVLVQANLLMFCNYILKDVGAIHRIIPAVQGTGFVCIPLWTMVMRRFGKRLSYFLAGSVLFPSVAAISVITDSRNGLAAAFMIGISGPALYLVPYSMLPDVIEEDELRTGKRREGMYTGFFTVVLKFAVTGALCITNFSLKAVGYQAPQAVCSVEGTDIERNSDKLPDGQSESVLWFLKVFCGALPAAFIFMAMVCAWFYPITRTTHARIAKLAAQARLERLTQDSEISSVTSTHSPRDVQALTDFLNEPWTCVEEQREQQVGQAMTHEYTEAKYQGYQDTLKIARPLNHGERHKDQKSNCTSDEAVTTIGTGQSLPVTGSETRGSSSCAPVFNLPCNLPAFLVEEESCRGLDV